MKAIFQQFVNEYKGKPLNVSAYGGGFALANLNSVPGSPSIVDQIFFFSSKDAINGFMGYETWDPVSFDTVDDFVLEQAEGFTNIGIAARLTDKEFTEEKIEAWVAIDTRTFYVRFPHLTVEELQAKGPLSLSYIREWEDTMIAMIVMKILLPSLDWEIPDNILIEEKN